MTKREWEDTFPRFDDTIVSKVQRLWYLYPSLDAISIVVGKWTPTVMLFVIGLAFLGVGVPPSLTHVARIYAWTAISSAVLVRIVNEPISLTFKRRRPFERWGFTPLLQHDRGESFPSNHASGAFALAMSFWALPGFHIILPTLAVLLAMSRVYHGLHYVTDVLAGALHGTTVAWIVLALSSFVPAELLRLLIR